MNPIEKFLQSLLMGGGGSGGLLGGPDGDRLQDPASARVGQAFDTVAPPMPSGAYSYEGVPQIVRSPFASALTALGFLPGEDAGGQPFVDKTTGSGRPSYVAPSQRRTDGDRLSDPASARVAKAFDVTGGTPAGGPSIEQIMAYAGPQLPQNAPVPSARPEQAAEATPGETRQGPDGQTYQYAETRGMAGASGPYGWIPVNAGGGQQSADPYLAWQRGMGSGGEGPMPSQGRRVAGSDGNQAMVGGSGGDRLQGAPAGGSGGGVGGLLGQLFNPGGYGRNRTVQWLTEQGMDQGTATLLASDRDMLRGYLSDRLRGKGQSEYDQRAAAARQYGLDPASDEGRNYILSGKLPDAKGGAAEVGLQPLYGQDAEGNPVVFQLSKSGEAVLTRMPDGVTVAKNPIEVDTGTGTVLIDPVTRQPVATIQKDLAGAEAAKVGGKSRGEAAFDLPRVEDNATLMLGVLDRMKQHPGREGSTGFVQGLLPSRTSDQVDFQSLVDQTQGQAFLQAYQTLKGGGQITEVEGAKAERALSRLGNQRLSDEDYLRAISDFEDVVNLGLARARKQAGVTAPASGEGWNDVGNGVRIRRKQ